MDQSLVFYESDRSADPCLQISAKDIVCLGVGRPDSSCSSGFIDRYLCVAELDGSLHVRPTETRLSVRFRYTFELYLTSENLYQFGLETADDLHSWTKAIGKVRSHLQTPFLHSHCNLSTYYKLKKITEKPIDVYTYGYMCIYVFNDASCDVIRLRRPSAVTAC